ncbi:MAG: hypothetical protein ACH37Z_12015 [Anaerolineae bacterium]|jgi:hypothetical protein|nr:hypothetical protein [Ardenticatenia bacterium]MBK8540789.1 hypothetical protein [Ardenticatenia bacterium]HQZ70192.1 hypothetical protein [Anaerolineae bacterium]HRA20202.1 hypothetical protein [Anaerolineae bacterium]
MTLGIEHCPKCRAMQAPGLRCVICGARLPGGADDQLGTREILNLSGILILWLAGFVLAAVLLISLVGWLLG